MSPAIHFPGAAPPHSAATVTSPPRLAALIPGLRRHLLPEGEGLAGSSQCSRSILLDRDGSRSVRLLPLGYFGETPHAAMSPRIASGRPCVAVAAREALDRAGSCLRGRSRFGAARSGGQL